MRTLGRRCSLALPVALFAVSTAAAKTTDTRTTMQALYEALSSAFLQSLEAQAFQDVDNRESILLSLRMLSANATYLEQHTTLDPSYDYARRSLARDCRNAAERFERQEYVGTSFVLHKLIENCVTCHSKLPAGGDFAPGRSLVDDERVRALPDEERLKLEIATRQFDRATRACEAILRSPKAILDDLLVAGIFEEYFKLTLRVDRNVARAISELEALAARSDAQGHVSSLVASWIGALKELEMDRTSGDELPRARKLIRRAQESQRFPADRRGLIYFVDASGLFYEFLATEPQDRAELSEAYYLLGLAESHIARSYWVSETDFFLERAVRLAPQTRSAREAFDLLEAYTSAAFTGSAGLRLPSDVAANLDELRSLIEASGD